MVSAGKSGSSSRPTGSVVPPSDVIAVPPPREKPRGRVRADPAPSTVGRSARDGLLVGLVALDGAVLRGGVRAGDLDLAGLGLLGDGDAHREHAVVVAGLESVRVERPPEHELPAVAAERPLGDGPLRVL